MTGGDRRDYFELECRPDDLHLESENVVDLLEDGQRRDGSGDHGLSHV
jgi:hypothetical protein